MDKSTLHCPPFFFWAASPSWPTRVLFFPPATVLVRNGNGSRAVHDAVTFRGGRNSSTSKAAILAPGFIRSARTKGGAADGAGTSCDGTLRGLSATSAGKHCAARNKTNRWLGQTDNCRPAPRQAPRLPRKTCRAAQGRPHRGGAGCGRRPHFYGPYFGKAAFPSSRGASQAKPVERPEARLKSRGILCITADCILHRPVELRNWGPGAGGGFVRGALDGAGGGVRCKRRPFARPSFGEVEERPFGWGVAARRSYCSARPWSARARMRLRARNVPDAPAGLLEAATALFRRAYHRGSIADGKHLAPDTARLPTSSKGSGDRTCSGHRTPNRAPGHAPTVNNLWAARRRRAPSCGWERVGLMIDGQGDGSAVGGLGTREVRTFRAAVGRAFRRW